MPLTENKVQREKDPEATSEPFKVFDTDIGEKIQGIVLVDDEGDILPFNLVKRPLVSNIDFGDDIALGNIPGFRRLGAQSEKESLSNVDNQDIWNGPTDFIPIPSPAGEQMTVVSSDANDAAAGTGVQEVRILYLDINGEEQIEDISMDGTNPVNTIATDITFVNEFHAKAVGATGYAEGDIDIHQLGAPAVVYARISQAFNVSMSSLRKVQAGKTGYVKNFCTTAFSGRSITIRLLTTSNRVGLPGVFVVQAGGIIGEGDVNRDLDPPIVCPPGTIIKLTASPSLPGPSVTASWRGYEG